MKTAARRAIVLRCFTPPLRAQSLAPRAYVITPVGSNAVTITENLYTGGIEFNSTVPITGASGYIRFGGNYQAISVAWQYSWIGKHLR